MGKVLVLGAGASRAYGYPLGGELRQRILTFSLRAAAQFGIISERSVQRPDNALTEFQGAFRISSMYSIDAFLARRPEFADIGKKCIAAILMSCEHRKALFTEAADKDHWYQYLFYHYAQVDWDELSFDDLSVITFNYDRSLEHFLHGALQAAYGKTPREATEKLQTLRVLHIYGALGIPTPCEVDGYRRYDASTCNSMSIDQAASLIEVIPEGRINSPTLTEAREWLRAADAICFLGFGFDSLNVERLAENEACSMWKSRGTGHVMRTMVGTCIGLTDAEKRFALLNLTSELPNPDDRILRSVNCTQLLRETLFLQQT